MSKEEKGMKFPPVSEEEREVVEKITPEAWDQILGHAQAYRITDQKMKDFAYILGDPVGGAHLGRKGNGVPEMRAILVDGSTKGELAQLNTDQVLEFFINNFNGSTLELKPLADKLQKEKEKRFPGASATADSNGAQNISVLVPSGSASPAIPNLVRVPNPLPQTSSSQTGNLSIPNHANNEKDGSCLGRMKDPIPTEDADSYYDMGHKYRGKAVIFNNMDFDPRLGLSERKDAKDLEKVLEDLGFDVDKWDDYTSDQIKEKLAKIRDDTEEMNEESDCLLVVVLSHGGDYDVIYAKDKWYKDSDLWNPFLAENCPTLAGKPKLFFLNACRGEDKDNGAEADNNSKNKKATRTTLPNHADFLIARSTVPGYVSWRNPTKGSPFIQVLCEVLDPKKGAYDDDLLSLLVKAQRIVATKEMGEIYKQMPSFTCQLTKKMQMKDNKEKTVEDEN